MALYNKYILLVLLACARSNGTIQRLRDVSYETCDRYKGAISMRDTFVQNNYYLTLPMASMTQQKVNVEKAREIGLYRYYDPWLEHLQKSPQAKSGSQIRVVVNCEDQR